MVTGREWELLGRKITVDKELCKKIHLGEAVRAAGTPHSLMVIKSQPHIGVSSSLLHNSASSKAMVTSKSPLGSKGAYDYGSYGPIMDRWKALNDPQEIALYNRVKVHAEEGLDPSMLSYLAAGLREVSQNKQQIDV